MSTFTGTTTRTNASTPLDSIAQLINLHRLPGESLKDFKARVLDNYIHPANSTYEGLYNGIPRELGINNYTGGIIIDVERIDGVPVVDPIFSCAVDDLGLLIGRGANDIAEYQSTWDRWPDERWSRDLEYLSFWSRESTHFLIDLLTLLNATAGLEAIKWGTAKNFDRCLQLRKQSSLKSIANRALNGTNIQTFYEDMTDSNWIVATHWSPDSGITNKVDSIDLLTGCEEYAVPDFGRTLHTYQPPQVGTVDVLWNQFPMIIPLSPVIIRTFRDYDFMSVNMESHEDVFGDNVNGIPTVEGADMINEGLSVAPMYWGE